MRVVRIRTVLCLIGIRCHRHSAQPMGTSERKRPHAALGAHIQNQPSDDRGKRILARAEKLDALTQVRLGLFPVIELVGARPRLCPRAKASAVPLIARPFCEIGTGGFLLRLMVLQARGKSGQVLTLSAYILHSALLIKERKQLPLANRVQKLSRRLDTILL
jgi:hypothetical protein